MTLVDSESRGGSASPGGENTTPGPGSGPRRRRWRNWGARPVARDHALGLLRFIGFAQILGGSTLVSGYAGGGPALDVAGAGAILVALGLLQLGLGLFAAFQPRPLKRALKRWPGRYVAAVLAAGAAVTALGGSDVDTYWVTSAQAIMFAAGVALPGLRMIPAAVAVTAVGSVVWITFDGSGGGFDDDGLYLVAILSMAKVLVVGLWLGRMAGAVLGLLDRWHAIEEHERGAIGRLRAQLGRVDEKAEGLGRALARLALPSAELAALRVRLQRGVDLPVAGRTIDVAQIVADLTDEHEAWDSSLELHVDVTREVRQSAIDAVVAAEIASVARRQIVNVARHAPAATRVTLGIERLEGQLRVVLTDDGGGTAPARTGGGTAWSAKQLQRAGGSTRYFDAAEGVGLEVVLPLHDELELSDVPTLSISQGLRQFAAGLLTPIRWSGYIGDTVYVRSADGIDERWLMMPIGAILIELALWRGLPGRSLDRAGRGLLAAVLSALLMAAFTIPAGSPDGIVPATTSVLIAANLLLMREYRFWAYAEALRFLAFLPLLFAAGPATLTLGVVYPAAFYAMTFGLTRFIRRAERLEGSALDAVGRAALASATVRGLALHHDAIDVILRAAPETDEIVEAGGELEDAIVELADASEPTLDPRDIISGALAATVLVPTHVTSDRPHDARRSTVDVLSPLERIALVEIASLAAEERASCTPPGLFGRRRLRALHAAWVDHDGAGRRLSLRAEPQLRPPDPARVQELVRVGRALGVVVESGPDELHLTYSG